MDLLSLSSEDSAADVSPLARAVLYQRDYESLFPLLKAFSSRKKIFVNSLLLKTHAEKLRLFFKEVTIPNDLCYNPLQMGSFRARSPSSFFNMGLNHSVHHPLRTTQTHTDTPCRQRCIIEHCV